MPPKIFLAPKCLLKRRLTGYYCYLSRETVLALRHAALPLAKPRSRAGNIFPLSFIYTCSSLCLRPALRRPGNADCLSAHLPAPSSCLGLPPTALRHHPRYANLSSHVSCIALQLRRPYVITLKFSLCQRASAPSTVPTQLMSASAATCLHGDAIYVRHHANRTEFSRQRSTQTARWCVIRLISRLLYFNTHHVIPILISIAHQTISYINEHRRLHWTLKQQRRYINYTEAAAKKTTTAMQADGDHSGEFNVITII